MKKLVCGAVAAIILIGAAGAVCGCKKKKENFSAYDIYASYDEESCKLSGTVKLDYYNNTENELTDLKFNMYGNAFREDAKLKPVAKSYENAAYYGGKSYGGMQITGVENCGGWNVGGEDENLLTVNLSDPIYPEERTQVSVTYELQLAKVNHRTGITKNCVNLGNFYPILCAYTPEGFKECAYYACGDPFVSDCANYSVTIDLPPEYVAASSGKLTEEATANGRKRCSYTLDKARDFALVLSKDFKVISENVGGVEVSYYYLSDTNAQASLAAATKSLDYFGRTFGDYAYPTLSVVQTGFLFGGMEYPALTMIADGLTADENAYTIVHENAHQWWYAMVGSDQTTCAWQDEGLAEYSTLMFFENNEGYGFTRTGLLKQATNAYRAYFTVYNQLNGTADTSMTRGLDKFTSDYEYNNVTYNKGLIMFEALRNALGESKFLSALREYFEKNEYKIASEDDLFACFISRGNNIENLFDAFTRGKILI